MTKRKKMTMSMRDDGCAAKHAMTALKPSLSTTRGGPIRTLFLSARASLPSSTQQACGAATLKANASVSLLLACMWDLVTELTKLPPPTDRPATKYIYVVTKLYSIYIYIYTTCS